MPDLLEVRLYLDEALKVHVSDHGRLNDWLDQLLSEVFGQVLAVNLYIDLSKGSLEAALVGEIIERMSFPALEARIAFTTYPEPEGEQLRYVCKHAGGLQVIEDDDNYVRVMKLKDLIEYYLRVALTLPASSYEAEKEVLDTFVVPPPGTRRKLGVVTKVWRGGRMNVWVGSKKELDAALSATGGTGADGIRDRFGLFGLSKGTLVYVLYPARFRDGDPHIPTTLDINQHCHFYVSNSGGSGWGLTCGLNTASLGLKERVHSTIDRLTDEFMIELVGEVDSDEASDTDHLLAEALRRAT